MSTAWTGRRVTQARRVVASWLPAPCGKCQQPVIPDPSKRWEGWVIGHKLDRATHPELTWSVDNWRPEHADCSNASGQSAVIAKAKAQALASVGVFPASSTDRQPPPLPAHIHGGQVEPLNVRPDLVWDQHTQNPPLWLWPLLTVPANASVPLAMSPVHPRAVDSYGWEAIDWVSSELGIKLRWWQQLAFVRQLEHDDAGRLVWRTIIESTPRRAGKSVRLRAMALWRLDNQDLFGEPQLALHTGKDVAIVREIHRQAWRWAQERDEWGVRRGVGQEEVSSEDGTNRWLVRSTDSVYGYDVTLGMVDEAWAVDPTTFDEGLEPATLERESPQLVLTSTSHRRATSLMRKKMQAALAAEDGETLLLLWGARPGDDPADPATWRAASPHWSASRERMIAAKYERALAGETDPTVDDPDPMQGFLAQYLNVWRMKAQPAKRGDAVISAETWGELAIQDVPDGRPKSAAIESWFNGTVSLALAWRGEVQTHVHTSQHQDLASAVTALKASGFTGQVLVGESLAKDPALKGVRVKPVREALRACVADLVRLLAEGALSHDGGEHLTTQVLALRTAPGVDGPRMQSAQPADAVKAAVWAVKAARAAGTGRPRILVASA